jgi:hypothetical protein
MPANRYTVAPGMEFNYPADEVSRRVIKNAGGRSKLSDEEKTLVTYKTAIEGEDCSDMPSDVLALYVERGWILTDQEIPKTLDEDFGIQEIPKTLDEEDGA